MTKEDREKEDQKNHRLIPQNPQPAQANRTARPKLNPIKAFIFYVLRFPLWLTTFGYRTKFGRAYRDAFLLNKQTHQSIDMSEYFKRDEGDAAGQLFPDDDKDDAYEDWADYEEDKD